METKKIQDYLSQTWIIGRMFRVGTPTLLGSFYEFFYLFIWSILPFALGALVLYVGSDATNKSFIELGVSTFKNGELLVFTISMLAPILYLTLHDPERAEPFPHKLPISTAVALVIVTSAALFALLKASAVKDLPFVFWTSVILTAIALVFRFLAIVYHKVRMPNLSEKDLRETQENFVEDFRSHIEDELRVDQNQFTSNFAAHVGEKP